MPISRFREVYLDSFMPWGQTSINHSHPSSKATRNKIKVVVQLKVLDEFKRI